MNRVISQTLLGSLCIVGSLLVQAANPITSLPRQVELNLALSALPQHLRDQATIYLYNIDHGFEVAKNGSNGFHALVARQDLPFYRGTWEFTKYRDDILIPISFDAAGFKPFVQQILDVGEMMANGTPPPKTKSVIKQRIDDGYYPVPERVGVSYMLAPLQRGYVDATRSDELMTVSIPHYMFYAPNVTNKDIGGKQNSQTPFILLPGPMAYIIKFAGEAERAAIIKENAALINQVCEFKKAFCLPDESINVSE